MTSDSKTSTVRLSGPFHRS